MQLALTNKKLFRLSADPKYQHLNEDLHVEITAFAPPAEAHARYYRVMSDCNG